ncbi:decapping enzyme, scavenger [Oratosquilla oratoria]|uniref:decapping enzyme, scavenger n=1 Tax=Oratosquilla oratoria TaxID=337810 RepID=UPI003F776AC1
MSFIVMAEETVYTSTSLNEAQNWFELYKNETLSKWRVFRSTKSFGCTGLRADNVMKTKKILWSVKAKQGIGWSFDGVPRILVGKRQWMCHLGPDLCQKKKERYKRQKEERKALGFACGKNRNRKSKKVGCPAMVYLTHLIRFPEYKVTVNRIRARKAASKRLKDDIMAGKAIAAEHQFLLKLPDPSCHEGHPTCVVMAEPGGEPVQPVQKVQKVEPEIYWPDPNIGTTSHQELCPAAPIPVQFTSFENFEIVQILDSNEERKSIAVEGRFRDQEGRAVVLMQKQGFRNDQLAEVFSPAAQLKPIFQNDIYSNQTALLPPHLNELKVTTIYPAEEKHILRYQKEHVSFVTETPDLYNNVIRPYVDSASFSNQWIYNILEHKKEAERIVFEDPNPEHGFILLPDLKWTGKGLEDLYLQAIVHPRNIRSIRDLRGHHLPLLRNIRDNGTRAVIYKYGIPAHKLRVYFHYQPSFYHLHVHFSALTFEAPGILCGKAHLLTDVISNLEITPDYYERAVMQFTIRDNHPLKTKLDDIGYFGGGVA